MKLLGDDCWWAPLWMKRLQQRIGLGETELPDERKRPAVREPADDERALVGAGTPPPPAARPRPHDPTHPAADPRQLPPARTNAPSAAGTTRMAPPPPPQPPRQEADEPATTRLAMARNAVRNAVTNAVNTATGHSNAPTERTQLPQPPVEGSAKPAAPAQREEREIESWLGALRGGPSAQPTPPPPPMRPSADPTRAMPQSGGDDAAPTTAFSAQRPADNGGSDATTAMPSLRQRDQDPSTEKLNTREDEPKRRGGGMSAQDLLRREGRL
jgi:RND superfamily putative drug exporter